MRIATVVILAGALGMVSPLMVNFAVRYGLNPQRDGAMIVGIRGDTTALLLACGAVVLFTIGRGFAAFGQQYLGQKIGQDVAYDIRDAEIIKLHGQSPRTPYGNQQK